MVKSNVQSYEEDDLDRDPPDIFRAAIIDDAAEMARAISYGQSLDQFDIRGITTPIHVACAHRSLAFLTAAMQHDFNPWVRDRNQRLAIDHAVANGLVEIQRTLFSKMYESHWHIDNLLAFESPQPER